MSTQESRLGRRAVIGSALGGVAALVFGGLSRPDRAAAATGGDMKLGQSNEANASTRIYNPTSASPTQEVYLAGGGVAVQGHNSLSSGQAVVGSVSGVDGIGVAARTTGHYSQIAVEADVTAGNGEGIAVRARTVNGIGLYGEATLGGYGLQVVGRAVFNRSGKTTISGGSSSKTVSGMAMTGVTIVVATVQGNPAGVWVKNVSVSDPNNTFTIRLNKAAPSGGVTVGYFVVN